MPCFFKINKPRGVSGRSNIISIEFSNNNLEKELSVSDYRWVETDCSWSSEQPGHDKIYALVQETTDWDSTEKCLYVSDIIRDIILYGKKYCTNTPHFSSYKIITFDAKDNEYHRSKIMHVDHENCGSKVVLKYDQQLLHDNLNKEEKQKWCESNKKQEEKQLMCTFEERTGIDVETITNFIEQMKMLEQSDEKELYDFIMQKLNFE